MAKSISFKIIFILLISIYLNEVISINSNIWHKAWQKFCYRKSIDEKELKQLKECDSKLTKERKSLLSFCIDGVDSPLSDTIPKLCQIPNDWSHNETRLFYNCMNKDPAEVYKSNPNNLIKEFEYDLCITKLLAPDGWENLCLASNIPTYKAKIKVCADTHPMIKKPIKECVAKNSNLKSKISNILPIPCQYLNHSPQLKPCIENYENELMKNTELWQKYRARGESFMNCLTKLSSEMRKNKSNR